MRIGKIMPVFARGNVYSSKRVTCHVLVVLKRGAGESPAKVCGGEPLCESCLFI